jgi:hypothetical protein
MKKSFLVFFAVIAFCMTSCENWLTGESDHSPEIYASYFYVNPVFIGDSIISAEDTLFTRATDTEGQYRVDSISLGDTVWFAATFYTHEKDLTGVSADWDTTLMDFSFHLTDGIIKQLTEGSKVEEGQLYFNPGFNRVSFPCTFSAKTHGILPLKLTVASTSQYSPTAILMTIPVKR